MRTARSLLRRSKSLGTALVALGLLVAACVMQTPGSVQQHRWWAGLGPVLPHDTFPTDCALCHVGAGWHDLVPDFSYDHEKETGVALEGAHESARCLRCHNDRGPVAVFQDEGCAGCHEDVHLGRITGQCTDCHQQDTWRPVGMVEAHMRTHFPLTGAHARVSCRRCHPGAEVGFFKPTDADCVSCHAKDLARAVNPNHIGLGWTKNCNDCHLPINWNRAEVR
jgi:hypothetical protein